MLQPLLGEEDEELWLLGHLLSGDQRYLFKAYEINKSNQNVLNALIAYYYIQKQYKKMFKLIVIAQGLDHKNPFILGLLSLFQIEHGSK